MTFSVSPLDGHSPRLSVPLPCPELPEIVLQVIEAVTVRRVVRGHDMKPSLLSPFAPSLCSLPWPPDPPRLPTPFLSSTHPRLLSHEPSETRVGRQPGGGRGVGGGAQSQQVRLCRSKALVRRYNPHFWLHTGTQSRFLSLMPEAVASPPTLRSGGVGSRELPRTCGSTSPRDSSDLGGRTGTGRAVQDQHYGTSRCGGSEGVEVWVGSHATFKFRHD